MGAPERHGIPASIWPAVALAKKLRDDSEEYRTQFFSTGYGLFPFLLAPEPAPRRALKPRTPGSAAWRRYQRRQAAGPGVLRAYVTEYLDGFVEGVAHIVVLGTTAEDRICEAAFVSRAQIIVSA